MGTTDMGTTVEEYLAAFAEAVHWTGGIFTTEECDDMAICGASLDEYADLERMMAEIGDEVRADALGIVGVMLDTAPASLRAFIEAHGVRQLGHSAALSGQGHGAGLFDFTEGQVLHEAIRGINVSSAYGWLDPETEEIEGVEYM